MKDFIHLDNHRFIQSTNRDIEAQPEGANVAEDWQTIVATVRDATERSHQLAVMMMHEYQATKRPFLLYLRTFESEAYEYFDKPAADGNPTTMWTTLRGATAFEQKLSAALRDRLPLLGIANPSDITLRAAIPRLQLRNGDWQSVARNLIEHAAIIVLKCDALASGVIWELETISAADRQDATIIVLPPKRDDRDRGGSIDIVRVSGAFVKEYEVPSADDPRLAGFPRIVAGDEVDFECVDDVPQFRGLLSSALADAAAAPPFDPKAYATYLNNQGVAHFNNKEYAEAMGLYDQALLVRRYIDDRTGVLTTLMNIGLAFIDGGQSEDAIAFLREAHQVARELERADDEGMVAAYLGIAHKLTGDMPEAIRWLTEAVPILEKVSPANVKDALVHLAMSYRHVGDLEKAKECALRLQQLGAI